MSEQDAIAFGEKVLALLDQGAFTATYKYAVLLALIDVCLEKADHRGRPGVDVYPRELALRVIELYWPQARPYGTAGEDAVILRQNSSNPFLYDIGWDLGVRRRDFFERPQEFGIRLRPGVGEHLVRLAGLLRPLVQQQWADRIVRWNRKVIPELEERDNLEVFLFGAGRANLGPVRLGLVEAQKRRCLYCQEELSKTVHVDHFLPWARYPDDGIHNLVATHRRCNTSKGAALATPSHVEAWSARFHRSDVRECLERVAAKRRWPAHAERTLSVARAVYLRLPADARLWLAGDEFVPPDASALAAALRGAPGLDVAADDRAPYDPGPDA